ncbi:50S ribosomal protein P1 [Methanococcoides methylutens]|uniref:50S ribosomal protein P1 n=1 Tax=Methanococcoides methylutens TaxID=2226 RepID=UPI0040446074
MEYIYAALLLHNAEKDITEESVTAVLTAAGVEVNDARAKALVAALEDVDIAEAMATAAFAAPAAAPAAAEAPAAEEAPAEEEKEEEEESGMAGLGALFG